MPAAGTGLDEHLMAVVHSSRTLPGTRPTRYSWVLISFGTPISMTLSIDYDSGIGPPGAG